MSNTRKSTLWISFLCSLVLILAGCRSTDLQTSEKGNPLPTPATPSPTPAPEGLLLGVYPGDFLQARVAEVTAFDAWIAPTGKRVSIAATFIDFEDPDPIRAVPAEMEAAWSRGYTPFVNLSVGNREVPRTAGEIANGELDPEIRAFARAFARWSKGKGKRAMIAPLQEMNGYWTSYGEDPENFKAAYQRIQDIFQEEGVPPQAVSWVFSPNGWSQEGQEFERYYPGDALVDLVGFNSFNFGDCSSWPKWEGFQEIFLPYLVRLSAMAPEKPIVVSSLGSVGVGGDQDQWLRETYAGLVAFPNTRAVIYFNRWETRESLEYCPDGTDYRIYYPQRGQGAPGFLEAIADPAITYYPPQSPHMTDLLFHRP